MVKVVNWNALEYVCDARLKLLGGTEFQFIYFLFLPSMLDSDSIYLQMKAIKSLEHCCVSPIQSELSPDQPTLVLFTYRAPRYKDLSKKCWHSTFSVCEQSDTLIFFWNVVFLSMTFKNNSFNYVIDHIISNNAKWV